MSTLHEKNGEINLCKEILTFPFLDKESLTVR